MKKKKIFKFIICLILFVVIGGCTIFGTSRKANADYIEELPAGYNLMFIVTLQESTLDFEVAIIYDIEQGPIYHEAYITLSRPEYADFTGYFTQGAIYFGSGSYVMNGELTLVAPYWDLSFEEYSYSLSHYNDALNDVNIQYQNQIQAIISDYGNQLAAKDSIISQLTTSLNSNKPSWGNFTGLLGTIFLYPIRFFKEGFDLQLFGVNVGHLIVGIGMLGITIAIIGIILHGRSKGGGKE